MALKLIWSQLAIDDLDDIANFIAKDSEDYAKIFVRKIVEQVECIPEILSQHLSVILNAELKLYDS